MSCARLFVWSFVCLFCFGFVLCLRTHVHVSDRGGMRGVSVAGTGDQVVWRCSDFKHVRGSAVFFLVAAGPVL